MALLTPLPSSNFTAMPWRNGAGVTREIAVEPSDDPAVPFHWRLSMADLAGDGPFSAFPGIDRVLLLLDGEGVVLTIDGGSPRALPVGEAIAFPADVPTTLTMQSPRGQDLNLMWDRSRVVGSMIVLEAGTERRSDETAIAVALDPSLVIVDGERVVLDLHDAVRIDGPAAVRIDAGTVALAQLRER